MYLLAGSILADAASVSISAMGGGYAGCASVAVIGRTTRPSYRGSYRSIANIDCIAYVAVGQEFARRAGETTSAGASLRAPSVAPSVARQCAAGVAGIAEQGPILIEKFVAKTRLGVRSAIKGGHAVRFRLATHIPTYV